MRRERKPRLLSTGSSSRPTDSCPGLESPSSLDTTGSRSPAPHAQCIACDGSRAPDSPDPRTAVDRRYGERREPVVLDHGLELDVAVRGQQVVVPEHVADQVDRLVESGEGDRHARGCRSLHALPACHPALVVAVLQREIDACADAGAAFARWRDRYTASSPPSGARNRAARGRSGLRRPTRLLLRTAGPMLADLLDAAAAAGGIRADVSAKDLLTAVSLLCHPAPDTDPSTAAGWPAC